ncbi:PREDICTED: cysteine-rich protein 2, partial [Gekko japonicus]|uniref:Cysteine-rich protein 2 n=1 Tax=Gekko japonicus TaxID=146911 RepID=A0ABM1K803_GEKJA
MGHKPWQAGRWWLAQAHAHSKRSLSWLAGESRESSRWNRRQRERGREAASSSPRPRDAAAQGAASRGTSRGRLRPVAAPPRSWRQGAANGHGRGGAGVGGRGRRGRADGTPEKVTSLGKDWHKFCLKCERCSKTLTPGGHAEHDGKPYCHKPCYATLFGPKGVNIGGAGSYIYDKPQNEGPLVSGPIEHVSKAEEKKVNSAPKPPSRASSITTFTGEPNICPRCSKKVYFAEKVTSLGKDWHRPCLRCERCGKTLTPGGHAEHDGQPYCHKPCYGILFGPKGEYN